MELRRASRTVCPTGRASSTTTAVGDDGWVEAVIPIEGTEHACGELLRLGADVEVVAPADLRRAMADTVELARAHELHELHELHERR
ncbi:WYL domain-containing protein [Streptomyces sp. NPDC048248]|uniref:WYL domain-containing protein n=1 Tax=Streptomyces sp. NPDC048248 TaxID=3365523 RepID=UPI00371CD304